MARLIYAGMTLAALAGAGSQAAPIVTAGYAGQLALAAFLAIVALMFSVLVWMEGQK